MHSTLSDACRLDGGMACRNLLGIFIALKYLTAPDAKKYL